MNKTRPGNVHIIGGGTVNHIRPHLAISAPAYGKVANQIYDLAVRKWSHVGLHMTKMACSGDSDLETNHDVSLLLDRLISDDKTKVIFLTAALCDFNGHVIQSDMDNNNTFNYTDSGKDKLRLKSDKPVELGLLPAEKLISKIRSVRKDIFLVAFKTTSGATEDEQFLAGLNLLKKNSCNLVLANDVHTRMNMIITPEQAKYSVTTNRESALRTLVTIASARCGLSFTRSTIVPGDPVPWSSKQIPNSLRRVVNWCIAQGAYRPFNGSTVGHFAVKTPGDEFLTSIRKSDFNKLNETGLVKIVSGGKDEVLAYGSRPSVGGQSQRIIFSEHDGYDCIVHAHIPLKENVNTIPIAQQWPYECGSHECGENTSRNLKNFGICKAVMLNNHGPNIVFKKNTDPELLIQFIEDHFDLSKSTDDVLWKNSQL